jgi:hypothetical protein
MAKTRRRRPKKIVPSKLYPLEEAAALLHVSEQTVKANLNKGKLEGTRIGPLHKWHVRGASIISRRKELNIDLLEGTD